MKSPDDQRVQNFRYGLIFWSPATGAYSVRGGILSAYRARGSDAGKLGLPVTEELPTVDGGGVYQQFSRGIVYWTPALGAHLTVGAIRERYAKLEVEKEILGFPTSGEITTTGYGQPVVYQRFQHGIITWNGVWQDNNDRLAHEMTGAIYNKVTALGGTPPSAPCSTNPSASRPANGPWGHRCGGATVPEGPHLLIGRSGNTPRSAMDRLVQRLFGRLLGSASDGRIPRGIFANVVLPMVDQRTVKRSCRPAWGRPVMRV